MNDSDFLIEDGLPASVLAIPLREVWIAIRTDGIPDTDPSNVMIIGDGSREDPWDGSTALKLDSILTNFVGENTVIHFGPGIFRTGGSAGPFVVGYAKWFPQSGQKIIGAGKYQTTLLLTLYDQPSTGNGVLFYSIVWSFTYLDGFSLSDLTLDCGNDDQPMPSTGKHSWPQTTCSGVYLIGRNIELRRVRFVNLGTRGALYINGVHDDSGGYESYPAILALYNIAAFPSPAQSFNHILEDCSFEQVFHSNGRETSPVTQGVPFIPGEYGFKGFAMRRCFFDMDIKNRLPYPPTKVRRAIYNGGQVTIDGVTYPAGNVQTVETIGFHNVKANSAKGSIPKAFYVEINGAIGNTNYNGRFRVVSPTDNDGTSRTVQIDMRADPGSTLPTGDMTIQDSPPTTMDIVSIVPDASTGYATATEDLFSAED